MAATRPAPLGAGPLAASPVQREAASLADFLTLPFLGDREPTPGNPARRALWRDCNTGDMAADDALGAAWAMRLVEFRRRHPNDAPHLAGIVRNMMDIGKIGAVEVGFLCALELWVADRRRR
ncbi:MAG: hypothetical protein M3Y41_04085 [Pseudomonadota bacterium]|nr:hypothetical protein [Pseudomonadota bacterium]